MADLVPRWWNWSFSKKTLHVWQWLLMSVMCEGESSFLFLVPHPNTDWTNFVPFETLLFSHWIVDKLKSFDQFPFENKLHSAICVVELNYLIIFAFVVVCGKLSHFVGIFRMVCGEPSWLVSHSCKQKRKNSYSLLSTKYMLMKLTSDLLSTCTDTYLGLTHELCTTNWKNQPIMRWCKTQSSAAAPDAMCYFNIKISIFWFPAKSKCHSTLWFLYLSLFWLLNWRLNDSIGPEGSEQVEVCKL